MNLYDPDFDEISPTYKEMVCDPDGDWVKYDSAVNSLIWLINELRPDLPKGDKEQLLWEALDQ